MKCTSRKHTRSCGKSTSSTPAPTTTQAPSKFTAILRKLDDSKFKALRGTDSDKAETLYWNLWGMYGLTPARVVELKQTGNVPSVMDYAWTSEVATAFYNHSKHRAFVKRHEKTFSFSLFKLNSEPSLVDRPDAKE